MTGITSDWLQFLHDEGIDAGGESAAPDIGDGFIAPLTHLGIIAASGEDAAGFLHSQLSNDIEHLDAAHARLAAYCSPKGRMLASLLIWRQGDSIMLQLPREIQAPIQKRLQMFVLRSKVKLTDVSETTASIGFVGAACDQLAALAEVSLPEAVYGKAGSDAGCVIRMPDAEGKRRYLWITDAQRAFECRALLSPRLAAPAAWRRLDIAAGLPMIVQATQEKFVPQMVNFELIGGVNFRKGCYPGQEIVARSQYLGKLKRRMLPADIVGAVATPGTDVYASSDPDQPSGMIVNAEPLPDGGSATLVELKIAVLEQDVTLHLGAADGPQIRILPLPYSLTETV